MSTIQETEAKWVEDEKILGDGIRFAFAFVGGLTAVVAMIFAIWFLQYGNWTLALISGLAVLATLYCEFWAISDLIRHNKLLRDELQSSYRQLAEAESDVRFLKPQTDMGKAEISPR